MRKSHDAEFKHHLVKPIDRNKLDSLIQEGAVTLSREGDLLATDHVA